MGNCMYTTPIETSIYFDHPSDSSRSKNRGKIKERQHSQCSVIPEEQSESLKDNSVFGKEINRNIINNLNKNGKSIDLTYQLIGVAAFNHHFNSNVIINHIKQQYTNEIEDMKQILYTPRTGLDVSSFEYTSIAENNNGYYKGQVNTEGMKNGYGEEILPNGTQYIGQYENDLFSDKGLLIQPNGDYYLGEFKDGLCQGKGRLVLVNELSYEGDWIKNKKHGEGIIKYDDGAVFDGWFIDGEKDGEGIFKESNGRIMKGYFKKEKIEGLCECQWNDGRLFKGTYKNGMMNGKGYNSWADGSYYEGDYLNGLKHGHGFYYWSNKKEYKGLWNNNLLHGKGLLKINDNNYDLLFRFGKIIQVKPLHNLNEKPPISSVFENPSEIQIIISSINQ